MPIESKKGAGRISALGNGTREDPDFSTPFSRPFCHGATVQRHSFPSVTANITRVFL